MSKPVKSHRTNIPLPPPFPPIRAEQSPAIPMQSIIGSGEQHPLLRICGFGLGRSGEDHHNWWNKSCTNGFCLSWVVSVSLPSTVGLSRLLKFTICSPSAPCTSLGSAQVEVAHVEEVGALSTSKQFQVRTWICQDLQESTRLEQT